MPALSGFSKSSRVRFRPYEHPKGGDEEIHSSAATLKARFKEERVFDQIERSSRCPEKGQSQMPRIDLEILRRFINGSKIEGEEASIRTSHVSKTIAEDIGEGDSAAGGYSSAPADFRNQLDVGVCTCVGEEKCVLCCTEFDLAAIPQSPVIERQHLAKKPNDVNLFYVTMPLDLALRLGFITEEALDSE
jgi:hypothetical protein